MAYQNVVLEGFFKAIFYTSLVTIYLKLNNSNGILKYYTFHGVKCREERKSSKPVSEE